MRCYGSLPPLDDHSRVNGRTGAMKRKAKQADKIKKKRMDELRRREEKIKGRKGEREEMKQ